MKPKPLLAVLPWILVPASLGVWCGWATPEISTAQESQRSNEALPSPSQTTPSAPTPPLTTPSASAEKPETQREHIELLGRNRRVEDLLVELEELPPGDDRSLALRVLAEQWFLMDRAAALAWCGTLRDATDRGQATCGMTKGWTREDSHAASAWVAALPADEERARAVDGLVNGIMLSDPSSALSWSIAEWKPGDSLEELKDRATHLAYFDFLEAQRVLESAALAETEKTTLLQAARGAWNEAKVRQGKWAEILPEPPTQP